MDTYSESKRYNDHMRTCKNILNKMKLLLNFTELPSDILIQTRESLKELNTITNDLLELKDGRDINTSQGKQNETNEINPETRNVTQKSKFSLPKIKVENNEKEDKNQNNDSNWEPDALPYNASFMSLALSANELEGVESKVSQICDSPSQTYEEKYKILRSVFFKEKIKNLNINNTSICFSPVCWTRNLNCNKNDALSLIRKDSKPKQIQKKSYTFGPTSFIAMQANIPANNNEDDDSDEDEPEKNYKDVSVNTKRIKYRQISNRRVDKNNSCDSQCPYEPSVESLPFELIEYEVSQKHYITKNFPKKLKEFTRSSINKIFDKRDERGKNDKYPYEPSMGSLPVEFKNTNAKPQIKESKEEEKDTGSTISSVSSDEDDELSNKEVQTENLNPKPVKSKVHIIPCDDKTCNYEDSDEETESDDSTESLISIPKDEEDEVDDYEGSDKSLSLGENYDEEAETQDQNGTAGTDENNMKFCVKSTCKIEKCLNKNKNEKRDELKQQAKQDDDEYEKIVDALTEQIIKYPKDIGKIYYEKGNKCDTKCLKNKEKSKKRPEPKEPTAQENENEKITKKDNIDDKKMSDVCTKQVTKKCPAESGIYDREYTKCPAEKCLNKKRDKRKPQTDEKILKDDKNKNMYEEPEKEKPIEEIKDAGRKSLAACKIPIKCPRENCRSKARLNAQDKPKPQIIQENIDENDKMIDDNENDEIKETPVEEINDATRKSFVKYPTEFSCPSEKCKRANKTKREKSKPEDEEKVLEDKVIEKKENLKNKSTRNKKIEDENITEEETKNKETGNDIKDYETSDKSSKIKENDEDLQDQNEAVTAEMDGKEIFCAKTTGNTDKYLSRNNNALTEKNIKSPKDIGKIYYERGETKCENLKCLKNKDKSKKRDEPNQRAEQEYENGRVTKKDQIDNKKINTDQIKKCYKPKQQIIQKDDKMIEEENDDDIYEEPTEIECPFEKCKKKNKKRNKVTPPTLQVDQKIIENENDIEGKISEDDNKTEDENISLAEEEKISNEEKDEETENETSVEETTDICRTVKVPIRIECPGKCTTKNKTKKQDKPKSQIVQVDDEIIEEEITENEKMLEENTADDEKMIEKTDEIKYKETPAEDTERKSLKCPTQIAKLNKRCPAEKGKKRHRPSVEEITETEEPKCQETKQSGTECVQRKSTACNTNPLPIIQDEATSTVQEGMKIKDMHAWALAYVKLEEDGAKLVQILHTTPYEPGRYLFKEPNELILFGPQAGGSRKSK